MFDAPICFNGPPVCLDAQVWMAPCMFECPLYVLIPPYFAPPPVCLDAHICVAAILNFHHFVFLFILNILSIFQNVP